MQLITITTDFGLKDGNVGVMKGVIHGIAPHATIIDLSHLVPPQNILEANFILARSVPYFPDGTVHIFVVDPGVGTSRRPMIAQIGSQYFVGPDNGVLTGLVLRAKEDRVPARFFHLDRPEYWLKKVSHVFHGRDIFSPVAAHFAAGVPIEKLGTEFSDPVQLPITRPTVQAGKIEGEIVYIDSFGNLATNISRQDVAKLNVEQASITAQLNGRTVKGMVNTFGERQPGDLVCLYSSTDAVIFSIVNGNACVGANGKIGDKVTLTA